MNRVEYIDIAKFFAISCVVMGHLLQFTNSSIERSGIEYQIWGFFLSFHMPLFAILSGCFFSNSCEDLVAFVWKKTKQLLLPYCMWIGIDILIRTLFLAIIHHDYSIIDIGELVVSYVNGITKYGYWFIKGLFLCFVFATIWRKYVKVKYSLFYSVIVLSLLGILPNMTATSFFKGAVFLYPFFITGYYLKNYLIEKKSLDYFVLFISFIVWFVLLFFWRGYPDTFYEMNTSIFEKGVCAGMDVKGTAVIGYTFFRIIIGSFGSLFFISLFKVFYNKLNKKICAITSKIGRYTLAIYLTHMFFVEIVTRQNLSLLAFVDSSYTIDPFLYNCIKILIYIMETMIIVVLCFWGALITEKNATLARLLWGKEQKLR